MGETERNVTFGIFWLCVFALKTPLGPVEVGVNGGYRFISLIQWLVRTESKGLGHRGQKGRGPERGTTDRYTRRQSGVSYVGADTGHSTSPYLPRLVLVYTRLHPWSGTTLTLAPSVFLSKPGKRGKSTPKEVQRVTGVGRTRWVTKISGCLSTERQTDFDAPVTSKRPWERHITWHVRGR